MPRLRASVDSGKLPGLLIAVARHGRLAYVDSAGYTNVERRSPMRSDAVFRIYSMTKPMTAVAIMQLVERGQLDLEDPVSRYLPAFSKTRVYIGGSASSPRLEKPRHPITIATLLTHTAGLTYGVFGDTPVDSIYVRANMLDPRRTLAQFADTIARLPLAFTPGSRWNYSMSMDVLGRVIEVVSHKTLDRYFADEILVPLGMRHTAFHATPEMRDHVMTLYSLDSAGHLQAAPQLLTAEYTSRGTMLFGGAGLLSTMGDYLRFAQMLLNGGELDGRRILRRETVALMMRNHIPFIIPAIGGWPLGTYGFGYGGAVRVDSATGIPGFPGTFRWAGYAATYFWIDPKSDLIAMLWTQFVPNLGVFALDNEFQQLVYRALDPHTVSSRRQPN